MTLAETITAGVNNPECAFFVGHWMGEFMTTRLVFFLLLILFVAKLFEQMLFLPTIEWIKGKVFHEKDAKGKARTKK